MHSSTTGPFPTCDDSSDNSVPSGSPSPSPHAGEAAPSHSDDVAKSGTSVSWAGLFRKAHGGKSQYLGAHSTLRVTPLRCFPLPRDHPPRDCEVKLNCAFFPALRIELPRPEEHNGMVVHVNYTRRAREEGMSPCRVG
ncbi:hypothetical protein BHM03_00016786 [Ensete ventricosum]|nr:hypothetical protein BHM03_00016786 [Ensete ventricosum]